MKKREKKIQVVLLIVGIFLVLFTYFYYPYMSTNKSLVKKDTPEDFPVGSIDTNENTTSFENLEYKGLYDLDKKFIVKSKKAHIDNNEPDIVHMNNMHVILYLEDGRVVDIFSDKGKYNKENYDCFFEKNVRATDGETKIFSDNLDLLGNKSSVKVYNNVSINYPTGSLLRADIIDYDFEKKNFKVSMFKDKRIKMKIFK